MGQHLTGMQMVEFWPSAPSIKEVISIQNMIQNGCQNSKQEFL